MIGRVSKNFKGSICIPSVSQKSMVANETFWLDDEMYWKADVQNALSKRMIVSVGDAPPPETVIYITNISKGSITIPNIGVIRAGETKGVTKAIASSRPVLEMKNAMIIRVGKRAEAVKAKRGRPFKSESKKITKDKSEWSPLAWNPLSEDGKKAGKSLPQILKTAEVKTKASKKRKKREEDEEPESLLIDPQDDSDVEEEEYESDDRVTWVDHEETQRRLASHPILGKKNANNRKRQHKN